MAKQREQRQQPRVKRGLTSGRHAKHQRQPGQDQLQGIDSASRSCVTDDASGEQRRADDQVRV